MKSGLLIAGVLALLVPLIVECRQETSELYTFYFKLFINNKKGCSIPVNILSKIEPLLLVPGTKKLVRADNSGNIVLKTGDTIHLACPGSHVTAIDAKGKQILLGPGSEATVTCVGGIQISFNGVTYNARRLGCEDWPKPHSWNAETKEKYKKCRNKSKSKRVLVKMGYKTSAGNVELIEACHDVTSHNTIYAKFILTSNAAIFRSGLDRPDDWMKGDLFVNIDPNHLYKSTIEASTFGTLLGSSNLGNKYIDHSNNFFLSRGHLVAMSDFCYFTFQTITFYYANALPQWQTFNSGNWNELENKVKTFITVYGNDLEVYTGGHGVATLPNNSNIQTNLYLSTDKKMPVPRMFWKIVYDPIKRAGIAFIGLNNPYQTADEAAHDVLCTDISGKVKWWKIRQPQNVTLGYIYMCEVKYLRARIPDIPDFKVNSVLDK